MVSTVNIVLDGELDMFVKGYIKRGYATSKTEVLRLGLIKLKKEEEYDDLSDDPELYDYLLKVKQGKIKPKIVGSNDDLRKLLLAKRSQ